MSAPPFLWRTSDGQDQGPLDGRWGRGGAGRGRVGGGLGVAGAACVVGQGAWAGIDALVSR